MGNKKFILYYRKGNVEIRGTKVKRRKRDGGKEVNQMKYENGRRKRDNSKGEERGSLYPRKNYWNQNEL